MSMTLCDSERRFSNTFKRREDPVGGKTKDQAGKTRDKATEFPCPGAYDTEIVSCYTTPGTSSACRISGW